MNKSNSIAALAAALAKAQGELKPAEINATNPFLKSRFADLGSVIEAVRPTLAKYELSFAQFPLNDTDRIGIETILMHSSGEWLSETVSLPIGEEKGKTMIQVAGSVITYLRRYSLSAVLGVYADEDTDGQQPARQAQQTQRAAQPTPAQLAEMERHAEAVGKQMAEERAARKPIVNPHPPTFEGIPTNGNGTNGVSIPAELKTMLASYANRTYATPEKAKGARGLAAGILDEYAGDTERRRSFLMAVFGKDSSSALTDGQVYAILAWKDHPRAKDEVNRVIADWLKIQGQQELFTEPQPA